MKHGFCFLSLALLAASPARAAESGAVIPEPARAMMEAAALTNEPARLSAVADAARAVYPDGADAIDAYANALMTAVRARLAAAELIVVTGKPPEETPAPGLDAKVEETELTPGKAPEFLKLGDWAGKASASGLVASGNARNAAGGFVFGAKREFTYFTHNVGLYLDYGKSNGAVSQQRWGANYKLDYLLGDRSYAYGRVSYDEDAFSGFDYKLFGGLGVGRYFARSKAFTLKGEGGPGYQYSPIDDTRMIDRRVALYASGELDWLIRDGLKFEQDLNATWTDPTTTLVSSTALTTLLTDTLSTGVSFLYRYETDPPPGRVNTDTTLRINLSYGF